MRLLLSVVALLVGAPALAYDLCETRPGVFDPTACDAANPADCVYAPNRTAGTSTRVPATGSLVVVDPDAIAQPNRPIPVIVGLPDGPGPFPVVLLSHGGSEGVSNPSVVMQEWFSTLPKWGYLTITMAHSPRTPASAAALCTALGIVSTCPPATAWDRPFDTSAVIDWLEQQQVNPTSPLFGKVDLDRIGLLGHSAGASNAGSVAGGFRVFGTRADGSTVIADTEDRRVQSIVALSPPGPHSPGVTLDSYHPVRIPELVVSATGDRGDDPTTNPVGDREQMYFLSDAQEQYRLYFDSDAIKHETVNLKLQQCSAVAGSAACLGFTFEIASTTLAFLDGYLRCDPDALAWLESDGVTVASGGVAEFEKRDPPDADGDRVPDGVDACPGSDDRLDADFDGTPDGCDACPVDPFNDRDGDTTCDSDDPCPLDPADDIDGDGACADVDPCPLDPDDDLDQDGVCGDQDACPDDPANDADGDGVCGSLDVCPGSNDTIDLDGDGTPDGCDQCPLDAHNDRDGDGSCDSADDCPLDPANDADGDGECADVDPCPADPADDADGDQMCADLDPCPVDPENDADGDGICEVDDDCPTVDDPGQSDADVDGIGDACEPDSDGDGVIDDVDDCVFAADPDQVDLDGDGVGDACDADDDGDQVPDGNDACLGTQVGAVVLTDGCSVDQRCACAAPWKNHGAYVVCVVRASTRLLADHRITLSESVDLVEDAAESSCGFHPPVCGH